MNQAVVVLSLLAVCFVSVTLCDKVPFKDCGSKGGTIATVDVTPCPNLPCIFKRGTNISVSMDFKANSDITSAKTVVYGFIAGVKVPFPLPDSNACHDMTCPIKSGTTVTYNNKVFVQETYPKITLVVQWEVTTDSGMVTCFTVPAQISD